MTRKIILTLQDEFLYAVDAEAKAEHRSRSELIREALREYLADRGRPASTSLRAAEAAGKLAEARKHTVGKGVKGSELIRQWRYRLAE